MEGRKFNSLVTTVGLWGYYQAGGKEHTGECSGFLAGVQRKKETVQSSISQEPGSLCRELDPEGLLGFLLPVKRDGGN